MANAGAGNDLARQTGELLRKDGLLLFLSFFLLFNLKDNINLKFLAHGNLVLKINKISLVCYTFGSNGHHEPKCSAPSHVQDLELSGKVAQLSW